MRVLFTAFLAFLLVVSCSTDKKVPEFITFKTVPEGTVYHYGQEAFVNENYAGAIEGKYPGLDSLLELQRLYFTEKGLFDIEQYRLFWNGFRGEIRNRDLSREEVAIWVDLTGFLFQLTAEALVAEELERVAWLYFYSTRDRLPGSLFLPYVITRHTDNIHINLFMPAEINFTHSLGGDVTVAQTTDFPDSGRVLVQFGMETKQYIELYIRIPSWARQAEVTVKGVKYLATPGSYSKIAKKWKEGDEVEVVFLTDNLPEYITPGQ